jgi:hypothetical protein
MTLRPELIDQALLLRHGDEEARAEFIKQLTTELLWTADNQREVGRYWGIGPRALGALSNRANAMMIASISDPEALRAKLIEQVSFIVADAMQKKKPFLDKTGDIVMAPDPDHKAALMGVAFIAKVTGLDKPRPMAPEDDYKGQSLAELIAAAQQKLLPEGQSLSLEIQAEGEANVEERNEDSETAVPDRGRRYNRPKWLRPGDSGSDRDPT